jgi:hypothetical protein
MGDDRISDSHPVCISYDRLGSGFTRIIGKEDTSVFHQGSYKMEKLFRTQRTPLLLQPSGVHNNDVSLLQLDVKWQEPFGLPGK